ncbi:MAG: NosD domain-containing protein [Methanobacteriaceae archaeon]|nr:NosD domain-containing protein [Methanobacteriaceae archaeon]
MVKFSFCKLSLVFLVLVLFFSLGSVCATEDIDFNCVSSDIYVDDFSCFNNSDYSALNVDDSISDKSVVSNKFVDDSGVSCLGASKTSTKIVANATTMYYGSGKYVVAYLKTSSGKAISGQSVKITIDGRSWTKTTDSNGKVTLQIVTLTPKVYPCTIKFAGTSSYAASSKSINVTVKKWPTEIVSNNFSMVYGDGSKFVVTLKNKTTGKVMSGKAISFTFTSTTTGWSKVYNKTTNSNGKYEYGITLKPDVYTCVIKFVGDSINASCSKTVTVTVNKCSSSIVASNFELYYTASDKLSACLKDAKGNVLANKTINITINGKSYTKTTNSKGIVYMSITLKPGTYLTSISFGGDNYYKACKKSINVTVFPLVSDNDLFIVSKTIKEYFEKNHKLPATVTIGKNKLSMAEYLFLAGDLIVNPSKTAFYFNGSYSNPPSPSEDTSGGILNSIEYGDVFSRVVEFIKDEGRGPNYVSSSLGNLSFESIVVLASNILYSKSINLENPYFVTVLPWSVVSKSSTKFYSEYDVLDAASRVKSFIEVNNGLPNYVVMGNNNVTMASFLKMISIAILNIEGDYYTSIPYKSYDSAPNPDETIKSFYCLSENDYLLYAVDVNNFMNILNRAPNYLNASFGNVGVNSTIYMFCQVLDYYGDNGFMPDNVVINPWSKIINSKTSVASLNDVCVAANSIRNYIYTNHVLPSSVKIGSVSVSLDTFLELGSEIILKEDYDLCSDLIVNSISSVSSGSDKVYNVNLQKSDYIILINSLSNYIFKNKKSPSSLTQAFVLDGGNVSFTFSRNSLIYLVSDILASYKSYNVLPYEISLYSWSNLSSSDSKFFSRDQVISGAESFIGNNYSDEVCVNGVNISKIQFLYLLVETIYNIDNCYSSSVLLKNFDFNYSSCELAVSGYLDYSEYYSILCELRSNLNSNVEFGNCSSSLGDIGIDSLIYMYSQILSNYSSEKSLPEYYSFVPWVVISNPGMVYNYNNNHAYSSLSDAIFAANEGDVIAIGISENYIGDIYLSKMLNIISVLGVNVSLISNSSEGSSFILDNFSSGSYIADLNLVNVCMILNNSFSNTISNLNITNCSEGIILLNSSNNEISYICISNCNNGILDLNSSDNGFIGNTICNSDVGVEFDGCACECLEGNLISNNTVGVLINNSSVNLSYNGIFSNENQGVIVNNSENVSLDDNWWGSNSPVLSDEYVEGVDLCSNSDVIFDSWLVLNLEIADFYTNTTNQMYSKIVKASLGSNLGKEVYVANLPLLPIFFLANYGVLDACEYLECGVAVGELYGNYSGLIDVSVVLGGEVVNLSTSLVAVSDYPVINLNSNKGFKTIGEAVNDLNTSDGDTLKIRGGYYEDNLFIYKELTLVSDGEVILVPSNASKCTVTILSDGVVLNNLTIYGGGESQVVSVFGSRVSILNCNIFNGVVGVYLFGSSNSSLINNTISSSDYGVYVDNSDNNSVLFNWIRDNWYGIVTSGSSFNVFSGNFIFDNWIGVEESSGNNEYISNSVYDNVEGIFINDGVNISFKDDFVFGNYIGLFRYVTEDSSLVLDSVIENNTLADVQSFDTTGLVLQDSVWNCGPATLVNLFKLYGLDVSQEEISSIAGTDSDGTSLYGLYLACVHYGFNVSAWYLDSIEGIRVNDLVVLLLDGEYHFTLIKGVNETSVLLADSSFGILDLDLDVFEDLFSGYVLDLNSTDERGQRLNVELMGNITGTFLPVVVAAIVAAPEIYAFVACLVVVATYAVATHWPQVKSYSSRAYNYVRSGVTAIVSTGAYALSKVWPKKDKITKELNKVLSGSSSKVSYSPSTGNFNIKGYGSYSYSTLVSKGISAALLGEVQYKILYNTYLKSKPKERNKLLGDAAILESQRFDKNYAKSIKMNTAPKPPEGNETKILEGFYKFSLKHYNKGKSLINEGHTLKGLGHIALSVWCIDLSAAYLLYQLFPKEVFNKWG